MSGSVDSSIPKALEAALTSIRQHIQQLRDKNEDMKAELASLKSTNDDLIAENLRLSEQIAKLQPSSGLLGWFKG
jgi:prefoldin subunit 5